MAQIEIRLTQDAMIGSPPSPGPLGQPQPNTPARTTISYDALSRPFIRRTTQGSTVETTVFGYSSPSSVPTYLKDSAGKIIWRTFMAAGLLAYADTRGETPKVSFIHPDKRGDDIAETDAAGQLSRKNTYTEYGQIRQGPPPSPYGFLGSYGRFFDPQTALYLLGARLYDPTLGRFLSRDPMPGGSANDYEYGAGNPVMNADPSGTFVSSPKVWDYLAGAICNWAIRNPIQAETLYPGLYYLCAGSLDQTYIRVPDTVRGGTRYFRVVRYPSGGHTVVDTRRGYVVARDLGSTEVKRLIHFVVQGYNPEFFYRGTSSIAPGAQRIGKCIKELTWFVVGALVLAAGYGGGASSASKVVSTIGSTASTVYGAYEVRTEC
jgi:RHS repeat-associated protein